MKIWMPFQKRFHPAALWVEYISLLYQNSNDHFWRIHEKSYCLEVCCHLFFDCIYQEKRHVIKIPTRWQLNFSRILQKFFFEKQMASRLLIQYLLNLFLNFTESSSCWHVCYNNHCYGLLDSICSGYHYQTFSENSQRENGIRKRSNHEWKTCWSFHGSCCDWYGRNSWWTWHWGTPSWDQVFTLNTYCRVANSRPGYYCKNQRFPKRVTVNKHQIFPKILLGATK